MVVAAATAAVVVNVGSGAGAAGGATTGDPSVPAHAPERATAASIACHHRRVTSTSRKGRLLIALPMLAAPNFDRGVVFMRGDTGGGAAGLVLTRPGALSVPAPLPEGGGGLAAPPVVFVGGPVSQN